MMLCPMVSVQPGSPSEEYFPTGLIYLEGRRVVHANRATCQLLGLPPGARLAIGPAEDLLDAETLARVYAHIDGECECPAEGVDAGQERWVGCVNRLDGKRLDVEFRVRPTDGTLLTCLEIKPIVSSILEEHLAALVDGVPVGMVMVDPEGRIALVNAEIERLFQYRRAELLGQAIELLLPESLREHHEKMRDTYAAMPERRNVSGRQLHARRKDGVEFPIEVGLNPIPTALGTMVMVAVTDITTRLQMQENFRLVVHDAPCGMVLLDERQTMVMVNRRVEDLFEHSTNEMLGQPFQMLLSPCPPENPAPLVNLGAGIELTGRRKGGNDFPMEIGLNRLEFGREKMILVTIEDVTEHKVLESSLRHSTFHDCLTGLANRALFLERLEQATLSGQRYSLPFAVLMMDLDGFKAVNDELGHAAGDEVLCAVANRLRRIVRKSDTAARLGGDEFAALLPGAITRKSAAALASKIATAIRQPVMFAERRVQIGISIGIALFPGDGSDTKALLAAADQAMYSLKRGGRGRQRNGAPRSVESQSTPAVERQDGPVHETSGVRA